MKEHAEEAKDAGLQVAASAKDEGLAVVAETRRQAADLLKEATSQLTEQAGDQKGKAVGGLRSLGEELQSMAAGSAGGPAADLAHQASEKVTQFAGWLEQNDPGTLVEEMRDLARRKPGTFLLGALAAGVLAGRVTRGVQGAASDAKSAPPATPSPAPASPAPKVTPTQTPAPRIETPAVVGAGQGGLPR